MTPRARSITHIANLVAADFGLTGDELRGREQVQPVSIVRKFAMYVAREVTGHTYFVIGQSFHRDHSIVINYCKNIRDMRYRRPWVRARLDRLVAQARAEIYGVALVNGKEQKERATGRGEIPMAPL